MLRPEKVASPFTAAWVLVPPRVPLPGLVPIASVTLLLALGSEEHTSELQSHHDLVCRLLLARTVSGCCTSASVLPTRGPAGSSLLPYTTLFRSELVACRV